MYLDGVKPNRWPNDYERWIYADWGHPGAVYTKLDDMSSRCPFEPRLRTSDHTVIVRIPRDCFPNLEHMRAQAEIASTRWGGNLEWDAWDKSRRTTYADPGETASADAAASRCLEHPRPPPRSRAVAIEKKTNDMSHGARHQPRMNVQPGGQTGASG